MKRRMRWRNVEGDYHAFNRGARRLQIFADDGDRGYFLRLVGISARKHAVVVLAWCLLDNHYHIALRTNGLRMGRMIRDLEKGYARYYNKKTGHVGALFEGRFGSTWLPDPEAVAYVTRYIHGNSLDKGIQPDRYPWSSCRAYLGLADTPSWLSTRPVLDWIGGPEAYRRYLAELPPRIHRDSEEEVAQLAFVEHIRERLRRAFPEGVGKLSLPLLTAWAGMRLFALRPKLLARALGYASGRSVSANVARLEQTLRRHPDLFTALSQVIAK